MDSVHAVAGINLYPFVQPVEFACQMQTQVFGIVRIGKSAQLKKYPLLQRLSLGCWDCSRTWRCRVA